MTQTNLFGLAVKDSHHDCFSGPARARDLCLLVLAHVSGEAADKRLVYLKFARHFLERAGLDRKPDAMVHEPCGFLSNFQGAMNLDRGFDMRARFDFDFGGRGISYGPGISGLPAFGG